MRTWLPLIVRAATSMNFIQQTVRISDSPDYQIYTKRFNIQVVCTKLNLFLTILIEVLANAATLPRANSMNFIQQGVRISGIQDC